MKVINHLTILKFIQVCKITICASSSVHCCCFKLVINNACNLIELRKFRLIRETIRLIDTEVSQFYLNNIYKLSENII